MRDLVVNERVTIPADEFDFTYSRAGGPGGQNVNKVATRVTLRWTPNESRALTEHDKRLICRHLAARLTKAGELHIHSSVTREQGRNREDALERLAAMVRTALIRKKRRRKTKPTAGSKRRRLEQKKRRSNVKRMRKGPSRDE